MTEVSRLGAAAAALLLAVSAAAAGQGEEGQVYFLQRRCLGEPAECTYDGGELLRAQQRRPGTLELVQSRQGKETSWQIKAADFARLVRCEEDVCSLPSKSGCYAGCVASPPIPKLFDERGQRLYFTVVGFDHEVTLFAYDLATRSASLVLEDRSTDDIAALELSPGRRYLAYLRAYHGSACEDFARLRIRDLRERKTLVYPGDADPWQRVHQTGIITSDSDPRWLSDGEIELRRREWTIEACNSGDHPDDDRVSVIRLPVPPP